MDHKKLLISLELLEQEKNLKKDDRKMEPYQ